jgi:4'-phosphopantetheinyl transferase
VQHKADSMCSIVRWMTVPANFPVEQVIPLLADHEGHKAASFGFERDRQDYCAAHVLLRLTIHRAFGPEPYQLLYGVTGKPQVFMSGEKQIHVSLSHSHGLAAVAVSSECKIGVDVEALDGTLAIEELLPFALSDSEAAEWDPSAGREQNVANFLSRWTLTEAIAKATGQGLSASFRGFSVTIAPPRLLTRAPDATSCEEWQLFADAIDSGFLAAAAHNPHRRNIAFDVACQDASVLAFLSHRLSK